MQVSGMLTSDKTIAKALEQVQRYCSDTGTRFAVATNGYSFIVFRAIVEGVCLE